MFQTTNQIYVCIYIYYIIYILYIYYIYTYKHNFDIGMVDLVCAF